MTATSVMMLVTTPQAICALTHLVSWCIRLCFLSNHRIKTEVLKPVESTANLSSMARRGRALARIRSISTGASAGSSMQR